MDESRFVVAFVVREAEAEPRRDRVERRQRRQSRSQSRRRIRWQG